MKHRARTGVSLLEMSVVIALTAILATGAVVTYDEITRQSRITQNINNLDELDKAFRIYQSNLELIPNRLDSLHDGASLVANLHVDLKTKIGFNVDPQNLSRPLTDAEIQSLADNGLTQLVAHSASGPVVKEINATNIPEVAIATIPSRGGDLQWEVLVLGIGEHTTTKGDFIAQLPVFPENIQEGIYKNYVVLLAIQEQDLDAAGSPVGDKRLLSKPRIISHIDPKGRELINGRLVDARGNAL